MDGGPPGIQSIAARAAGCGLRGLLAQRCGLLSFPGDGSEAACALDPQSIKVWGGRWLSRLWVAGSLLSVFGCCPCQMLVLLCFLSTKTALGCPAASRERQQKTALAAPSLDLCRSRALRPDETATAGAEGGGPGLVSHRQGPVRHSGCPARTSRLAPDARVQEARSTTTPRPPVSHIRWREVGGWRMEAGGLVARVSNQMHVLFCIDCISGTARTECHLVICICICIASPKHG